MNKKASLHFFVLSQVFCFSFCSSPHEDGKRPANATNTPATTQLLQLEQARLEAINQLDTTQFKTYLAPQYQWVNAHGKLLNTQQVIQGLKKQMSAAIQEKHSILKPVVEFYHQNNFAIIKGIYMIEKKERNGIVVFNHQFSDLFSLDSNKTWQLIYSQHTRISNK